MKFTLKYTSESEKEKPENKDKVVISDESFALCEMINELINKIERTRLSLRN